MSWMKNLNQLKNWEVACEFSVGGFIDMGFSELERGKLLCISSQYAAVIDCDTGVKIHTECEYDEWKRIAVCDRLPDETIKLCSVWSGGKRLESGQGESVKIITTEESVKGKIIQKDRIMFRTGNREVCIFDSYSIYGCTFCVRGDYFALACDGGVTILKRKAEKHGGFLGFLMNRF